MDNDHESVGSPGFLVDPVGSFFYQRMNNGFKTAARLQISKHDRPQSRSIKRTISNKNLTPKGLNDLSKPLRPHRNDIPGEPVIIDNDSSTLTQHLRHRRLTTGNTTSQTHPNNTIGPGDPTSSRNIPRRRLITYHRAPHIPSPPGTLPITDADASQPCHDPTQQSHHHNRIHD